MENLLPIVLKSTGFHMHICEHSFYVKRCSGKNIAASRVSKNLLFLA